jgi:hypothetical protein
MRIDSVGDVYTNVWANYFSSSTVTGWSSTVSGREGIWTMKLGNMVWVWFHIEGTSNATTITFTLPYTAAAVQSAGDFGGLLKLTYDNSGQVTPAGRAQLDFSSSTVQVWKDATLNYGTWTASGSKAVGGTFWYRAA